MNRQSDLQSPLVDDHGQNGRSKDSEMMKKNHSINEAESNIFSERKDSDDENDEEDEQLDNSFGSEDEDEEMPVREASFVEDHSSWRKIFVNDYENIDLGQGSFIGNQIHTAKYTWWSFLPKNLFFQFTKLANVYFLLMMIFQMIPQITISDGKPTILMPLGFVVLVSMVKDIIEDSKRHSSDNRENSSEVL